MAIPELFIIEPDEAALAEYKKKAEEDAKQKELPLTLKGKEKCDKEWSENQSLCQH